MSDASPANISFHTPLSTRPVGQCVGIEVVGTVDGWLLGVIDGSYVGAKVGWLEGSPEGLHDGW